MVPLGRLHMRPFQWHLRKHWGFPQALNTIIPWDLSIKAQVEWWADESNILKGAPLPPKDHMISIYTDASNVGWGAQSGDLSVKGLWSERERDLHINVLELKAVLFSLQKLHSLCQGKDVLIVTDNSSVVAYINKQGGTRSAQMYALLWRLMTWCTHHQVSIKARHIPVA